MKLHPPTTFVASAAAPDQFPAEATAEVAFLGRSNVGKSSAINALTGRRRLAFSSKTPGRTQTVNFYDLGASAMLVDLPGYGYARVPEDVRAGWERLVASYLFGRRSLVGLVMLIDARRAPTPQDRRLVEWLRPLGVGRLYLLAKADKLPRAARRGALQAARAALAAGNDEVLLFSAVDGSGVDEARERLAHWLRRSGPQAGNKKAPG